MTREERNMRISEIGKELAELCKELSAMYPFYEIYEVVIIECEEEMDKLRNELKKLCKENEG